MEDTLLNRVYKHYKSFAKNLKLEREGRNLTQKEMADMLGITKQSYWGYESGIAMPTLENLLKISLLFDLSLDELFDMDK